MSNFITDIPYQLGTRFEENDVELSLSSDKQNINYRIYRSNRFSELYLFGKVFEASCKLSFFKGRLSSIQYEFPKEYFSLFINSINQELPNNNQLRQDPNMPKYKYYAFEKGIAIHLIDSYKDYFLLSISNTPSLPRIKKKIKNENNI